MSRSEIREFSATLVSPDGGKDTYTVDARNKTEARKKLGDLYRLDTPGWRNGFYSFSQHRLIWNELND